VSSLKDRLQKPGSAGGFTQGGKSSAGGQKSSSGVLEWSLPPKGEHYEPVKMKVHTILVDRINLDDSKQISAEILYQAAKQILDSVLATQNVPMSRSEQEMLLQELEEEVLGLGPLEPLLKDPLISDILVNGPFQIYVERGGKLYKTNVRFKDNAQLMHVIDRIVSSVGRRVDEKNPMVDSRMLDGSRFNAIIPPLAIDGAALSIRKFKKDAGSLEKLLGWKSMTPEMAEFLEGAVKARLNIVVSGGTGSGKTTLLNSLSANIPDDERIVTIEDSAELQLQQDHVVRLETRPPNIEGEGAITARELLINCLRMRPDRIIVGECRGGESLDMLQAMNTGHDGSLTTLHANSPKDAISRIETMCMMNDHPLPEKTIRQQISSAVHMIVQATRLQDGSRKVISVTEIVGMEGPNILSQEIFRFHQTGIDAEGKVVGRHEATGIRPKCSETFEEHGIELNGKLFEAPTEPPPMPSRKGDKKPSEASSAATTASASHGSTTSIHEASALQPATSGLPLPALGNNSQLAEQQALQERLQGSRNVTASATSSENVSVTASPPLSTSLPTATLQIPQAAMPSPPISSRPTPALGGNAAAAGSIPSGFGAVPAGGSDTSLLRQRLSQPKPSASP
jgi:pilus assembly protein CpaF